MTIEDARKIVSKYMPSSRMTIMYNNTALSLHDWKLSMPYYGDDSESWNMYYEQYVRNHEQEVIDYYQAREIINQYLINSLH